MAHSYTISLALFIPQRHPAKKEDLHKAIPKVFPIIMATTLPSPPDQQELITAVDLPENVLPFSVAHVKKAFSDAQNGNVDSPDLLFFSNFNLSELKAVERLRLPVRIHAEPGLLILKMITKMHEAMHGSIMAYVVAGLNTMGLVAAVDYEVFGTARYAHRLNPQSLKEADSALGPAVVDGWPGTVIEAGWSEGLGNLRRDAHWWLSAQLPPNNPRLVVLISFIKKLTLNNRS